MFIFGRKLNSFEFVQTKKRAQCSKPPLMRASVEYSNGVYTGLIKLVTILKTYVTLDSIDLFITVKWDPVMLMLTGAS